MLIQKLYSFMQKLLTESDIVVKSAIFLSEWWQSVGESLSGFICHHVIDSIAINIGSDSPACFQQWMRRRHRTAELQIKILTKIS